MHKRYRYFLLVLIPVGLVLLILTLTHGTNIPVLEPRGLVGQKERSLMFFALLLSLLVVVPVFTMTFMIAWKYREGNTKAKYTPDFDHSRIAETIWWTGPLILVIILSVVAWRSSHELDPFKSLASTTEPLTIQVVALDWKWLFIYPKQDIATLNYVQFPKDTPVNFEITADAPMNSFWIPQLGGQIYAMPGMSTRLHLMANQTGSYTGSSANISGEGFAGMHFLAKSTSQADFNVWAQAIHRTPNTLSQEVYDQLAQPSTNTGVAYYSPIKTNLYGTILMKFMGPANQDSTHMSMSGMGM
jgi:cytochrome o ubiquinol oxidase subunit II